jgi:hypothetical protein
MEKLMRKILLDICLVSLCLIPSMSTAKVLYETGWEYGPLGRGGVTDPGNPLGTMSEIGNTDQFGLGYADDSTSFAGNRSLRIDWQKHGEGEVDGACEWHVSTPGIMEGIHEYYVGWALKLPSDWVTGPGRKLLYRTGPSAESVLFQGTKGKPCGQNTTIAHIYMKNPGNLGGGTEDDPWNQVHSEKIGIGGPLCEAYTDDPCINWPGAVGFPLLPSDGRWHTIIYYAREHLTDGAHTLWIDGKKVIHIDKDSWNSTVDRDGGPCMQEEYNTAHADFSGFKFPTYYNFGPPHDQSEYWDSFIVATTFEEVMDYLSSDEGVACIHTADQSPCDGKIGIGELGSFISQWSNTDEIRMDSLMEAIRIWKG